MIKANHIIRLLSVTACCAIMALLTVSCHDDKPYTHSESFLLSEQQIEIGSIGRYYSITVQLCEQGISFQDLHASTDAEWIRLEADTISRDGRLSFYVNPNTDDRGRNGIINISAPLQKHEICVRQRSEADDGTNALNGNALTRKARVGYGYNMLMDYMDPASVTEPILDYERLIQAEQQWGTIITELGRAQQSLSYHSSYSMEEMSSWMSRQSTTETDFLFCNKSVNRFKSTSEYDLSQQTFGYSSLSKVIATRYVDEGKIQSIIRQAGNIFTNEFRDIYDQVNNNPTDNNVEVLVTRFGTHMVTYADLGGRLDYSVNFRSQETSRESVERYLKYKNGAIKESRESNEASHAIISNGGLNFDIYGGTDQSIEALSKSSSTKDRYGQIDPTLLGNWLNSIKASDPESVSLVRCLLQPIWQLFTNQEARVKIINHILALSYSEGGDVGERLQELGLDNYYQVKVTDELLNFSNSANSTLAKVVYYDGKPKVEVCNEYVPELRGDRRVTIFYPIFRGLTNIRRGFFPGDAENPPAEVTFDDAGGCYVRQLEGYGPGDRLTTLYYIDGAFYPTSIGIRIPEYGMTVKNEYLDIPGHPAYAVVKIGPTFWIRRNISDGLGFGILYESYGYEEWEYRESIYDDVLYAEAFNPLDESQVNNLKVGSDPDRWYVPSDADLKALMSYVGKNTKALFQGQQTGFNATFDGCEMDYDFVSKRQLEGLTLLYRGERCFIAFKTDRSRTAKNGTALMLLPDYTLTSVPISQGYGCRYPIRLCRTKLYKHDNL